MLFVRVLHTIRNLSLLIVSNLVFAQEGFEYGVLEIHGAHITPSIVSSEQPFRITYTGYNVGFGVFGGNGGDVDDSFYTYEVLDGEILLDYNGPGPCTSPALPLPPDYNPRHITFHLSGVPAGQYTIRTDMLLGCGDHPAEYQHELTVYDVEDSERTVFLETPEEGQVVSGVGLIRGWACYRNEMGEQIGRLSYRVDDGPIIEMAYGDSRTDTAVVCGESNTSTGFAAAEFWGKYGEGLHEFTLLAEGVEVESRTFTVAVPEEGFMKGLEATYSVPNFPQVGRSVQMEWSEADQNFIIIEYD